MIVRRNQGEVKTIMIEIKNEHWKKLDREFIAIQGDVDLDNYLSPVNRAEELERFKMHVQDNRSYNPQFEYDPVPDVRKSELMAFRDTLNPEDPVEQLYLEAAEYRLGEIEAAEKHTGDIVSSLSIGVYGKPDAGVLQTARHNLRTIQADQEAYRGNRSGRIFDAEALAALCRDAMAAYGFDWKVVVKPEMGCKMAVDNLVKEFWIREDVTFHESLVKMTVVHEIGTHVLRSENGYAQPLEIFGRGLTGYQFTEEGLAEYAEEQCGVLMDDTIYRISGRVIGADVALTSSFWDTYCAVKEYFDLEMAFDIAQRVKLGLRDTSEPGSYTKDYTYLAGLLKIREFFQTAQKIETDALFAGKVGFHHLKTVKMLQAAGYLKPPVVYPEWFQAAD
jgi:uncharacterized protein (TIGR02421 family)